MVPLEFVPPVRPFTGWRLDDDHDNDGDSDDGRMAELVVEWRLTATAAGAAAEATVAVQRILTSRRFFLSSNASLAADGDKSGLTETFAATYWSLQ